MYSHGKLVLIKNYLLINCRVDNNVDFLGSPQCIPCVAHVFFMLAWLSSPRLFGASAG